MRAQGLDGEIKEVACEKSGRPWHPMLQALQNMCGILPGRRKASDNLGNLP